MLIHNLVATGSISYNGVNISYVTGSQSSLDGLNQFSSSVNLTTGSLNTTTGSLNTATGSLFTASGSFSTRVSSIEGNYATTGSNIFTGAQTVCANITSTGTIIAQTLNVQQVTSSIVYSSGSNIFGCQLTDVQQMTGSVRITGSLNVAGNTCVVSICSPSIVGGTMSGTTIYGSTAICGAVICGGATTLTGALSGTSATFSGNLNLQGAVTRNINFYDSSNTNINAQIQYDQISSNSGQLFFGTNNAGTFATRLTISNTGAATFSSSVTANGILTVNEDGVGTKNITIRSNWAGVDPAINVTTNNALLLMTNNTERMRISSGGNVGIGVTPSAWGSGNVALDMGGDPFSGINASLRLGLTTNAYAIGATYYYRASGLSSQQYRLSVGTNNHEWYVAPSGTAGNAISYTQAMTLDASGNLGIGTTLPTDRLHAAAITAAGLSLQATGTGGTTWRMLSTDNAASISGGKLGFNNGSYRMVIDGSGNVGIGTTSPSYRLDTWLSTGTGYQLVGRFLAGTNANGNAGGITLGSTQTQAGYIYGEQTASNAGDLVLGTQNAGAYAERMRITSGGNVGIGLTDPSRKFQVMEAGTSTSGNVMAIRNDNTTSGAFINFIAGGGNAPAIGAKGNDIVFTADGYSGTERMRIFSAITLTGSSGGTGGATSIIGSSSMAGLLMVSIATQGVSAIFFINLGNTVNLISQSTTETRFSTTSGAANTANVYISGTDLILQNNIQATRDFYVQYFGKV